MDDRGGADVKKQTKDRVREREFIPPVNHELAARALNPPVTNDDFDELLPATSVRRCALRNMRHINRRMMCGPRAVAAQ